MPRAEGRSLPGQPSPLSLDRGGGRRRRDEVQRPRPSLAGRASEEAAVLGAGLFPGAEAGMTFSSNLGGGMPESLGPSPSKSRRGVQMGRTGGCTKINKARKGESNNCDYERTKDAIIAIMSKP